MRIGLLDAAKGVWHGLADIGRDLAHIAPVAVFGDLESVVFRKQGGLIVAPEGLERGLVLFVMHVGDALEEEKRENVGLEAGCIDRTAEDVGGFPKVGFELAKLDFYQGHSRERLRRIGLQAIHVAA